MFVFIISFMLLGCNTAAHMAQKGIKRDLDHYYFNTLPFFGLFLSVFTSQFIGTEYSDGTIRNKIVIGHTRAEIYLSNLCVCLIAAFLLFAVWAFSGMIGIPFLGTWSVGPSKLAEYLILSFLGIVMLTAIFTFISQLTLSKATSAILSILTALFLLMAASMIYNLLCEPETISEMAVTINGIEAGAPMPNPNYVGGTLRTILQALLQILPTGQEILIADLEVSHPDLMILSSVLLTVIITSCGIVLFQKKDLK